MRRIVDITQSKAYMTQNKYVLIFMFFLQLYHFQYTGIYISQVNLKYVSTLIECGKVNIVL